MTCSSSQRRARRLPRGPAALFGYQGDWCPMIGNHRMQNANGTDRDDKQ